MEPSESPKNNGTVQDPTTGSLKEIANNSYRQAVVVYIDILGFKKLIDDSKRNPEKVSEIAAILEAAKSRLGLAPGIFFLSREKASNAFFTQNFSDLTVRVRFIDHDSRIINDEEYASEAINEIAHLAYAQTALIIEHSVLVRGGICRGDILANPQMVFGPALVSAYTLESESAIYPRIVVERILVEDILTYDAQYPLLDISSMLSIGDDGNYFVDYLFKSISSSILNGLYSKAWNTLDAHRVFIQKNLREALHLQQKRISEKLLWMAKYHNEVIDKMISSHRMSEFRYWLGVFKSSLDSLRL